MSNEFATFGIRPELVDKLQQLGITEPTPIQKETIPLIMKGTDVIGEAQTGTGKTLAFLLPMLENINVRQEALQGLILTPTRELALQISEELKKLAPVVGAKVLAVFGGQDVERQLRKLENGVHIVVATPGRLLDHLRRESLQLYKVSMLVLDEADQMLHMGFLNDVQEIIEQMAGRRQTLLFSATMPQPIRQLAQHYMSHPQEVQVRSKQITLEDIEQVVIQTTDRGKQDALCRAIDELNPYLAMVFCRTKRRAQTLNEALQERGYLSDELHGDLSQAKREQVMKRFREAKLQILVATDIAARGLDVEGVTHVFNYDIPHDADSYIHRIGRTGRAGQKGVAVTFASPRDRFHLDLIERKIKMEIGKRSAQPGSGRVIRAAEEDSGRGAAGRGGARKEAAGRKPARGRSGSRASGAAAGRGRGSREAAELRGPERAAARAAERAAELAARVNGGGADRAASQADRGGWDDRGVRDRARADGRPARGGGFTRGKAGGGRPEGKPSRERNAFGGDADRKPSRERNAFGGEADRKPSRERNAFGGDADRKPSRERNAFGGDADRKPSRERNAFGGEGSARGSFRSRSGEQRTGNGQQRGRNGASRRDGSKPSAGGRQGRGKR